MLSVRAPSVKILVPSVRTSLSSLSMKSLLAPTQSKAIVVKAQIVQKDQYIDVSTLQDSGTEANLIHWKTVQCL
jgi:hypothetical protein